MFCHLFQLSILMQIHFIVTQIVIIYSIFVKVWIKLQKPRYNNETIDSSFQMWKAVYSDGEYLHLQTKVYACLPSC